MIMRGGGRRSLPVRTMYLRAVGAAVLLVSSATTNVLGQAAWRLAPDPIFTAGAGSAPAHELITRIVGAVRLDDGRYVVADGAELRLSVYDAAGRLERTFGRAGEGPGEFRALSGLWHTAGDTIGVWDSRLQRITRLRADGTVVRTDPIAFGPGRAPAGSGSLDAFMGALGDGRVVLAWLAAGRPVENQLLPDRMLFGLFDSRGGFERLLGSRTGMLRVVTQSGSGPFAFSPFPYAAVVRDTLVFTNGLDGIHFFDPAEAGEGPVRSLSVEAQTIPLARAWRQLDAALEQTDASAIMVELARSTDRSLGTLPVHARMISDSGGRLWLKQYDAASDAMLLRRGPVGGGRWIILETDGTSVAYLTMPRGAAPLAIHGDELLAVVRDELDVESFAVYRLIRE